MELESRIIIVLLLSNRKDWIFVSDSVFWWDKRLLVYHCHGTFVFMRKKFDGTFVSHTGVGQKSTSRLAFEPIATFFVPLRIYKKPFGLGRLSDAVVILVLFHVTP